MTQQTCSLFIGIPYMMLKTANSYNKSLPSYNGTQAKE